MKSTGIRRKVDDLGRVVIPAGIRRSLGIREGDQVEVFVDGERVVLAKPTDRCVFCGSDEELRTFRGKMLCRPCVASVAVLDEDLRARPAPALEPETPAATWTQQPSRPRPPGQHNGTDRVPAGRPAAREDPTPTSQQPSPRPEEPAPNEDAAATQERSPRASRPHTDDQRPQRDTDDARPQRDTDDARPRRNDDGYGSGWPKRRREPDYDPASSTAW